MKVRTTFILVPAVLILGSCSRYRSLEVINVATAAELETLLGQPLYYTRLILAPGEYRLHAMAGIDSTCGNCQDPDTLVPVTIGCEISGRFVQITGPRDNSAVIVTNAGYGLYFNRCDSCLIDRITITGGVRDRDGRATDAALVIKNSTVTIRNCVIRDNIGDSSSVRQNIVGIMGITGRENSHLQIHSNSILRNSWDGIALYRDAQAVIHDNLIDGVDRATGDLIGGGRGVAVGVTWNARGYISRNLVKRYWKGIGLFVDARGTVTDNIVEDIVTWGIAYWDAGRGRPIGFIHDNIIYNTGACGASITRTLPGDTSGHFRNNLLVRTGQNPKYDSPDYYCTQCPLAVHSRPDNFLIEDNLFFQNRRVPPDGPDEDLPESQFRNLLAGQLARFDNPYLTISEFYQDFVPPNP